MEIRNKNNNVTKVFAKTFEEEAAMQVMDLCNSSAYLDSKIRIMPDAHAGKGCVVGTTMTISNKVTPNLVGVDIGCGMLTIELSGLRYGEIDLPKLDEVILNKIPSGFSVHDRPKASFDFSKLKCSDHVDLERAMLSIGTLGGGNHFIEIDYSFKTKKYYLVIHSGSRKLGGDTCKYYQDLAFQQVNEMKKIKEELVKKLKAEGREREIDSELKKIKKPSANKDLACLSGEYFHDYLNDMNIVQNFAILNRKTMADIIIKEMGFNESERFETIHNYIDFKRMILRKGAVSAEYGEKLLIPINMRDGSLICVGKGNEDWNFSAPHGAGRLMSRSKAKELIDLEEYELSMSGIYSTSVCQSTLDEAPQAYKPMEEIIEAVEPTVDIIDIIKPEYNFKSK